MATYYNLLSYKKLTKVHYYTVQREDDEDSDEISNFIEKFHQNPLYTEELSFILTCIDEIGRVHGAKKCFFRFENDANALPPNQKSWYLLNCLKPQEANLRLYCVRLSESVVVLLNGDVKTNDSAQESANVLPHFRLANKIGQALTRDIYRGQIKLRTRLLDYDDDYSIIL